MPRTSIRIVDRSNCPSSSNKKPLLTRRVCRSPQKDLKTSCESGSERMGLPAVSQTIPHQPSVPYVGRRALTPSLEVRLHIISPINSQNSSARIFPRTGNTRAMKTVGWMLCLVGGLLGGFTAWAERTPVLESHLTIGHGVVPGSDITLAASILALMAVGVMWLGPSRLGGLMCVTSATLGFFGADQLWVTAGCILFVGSVLTLFSPPDPQSKTVDRTRNH